MDVMPVDPVELWNTTPFEPVIKDGKIWARGADDDKGQSFMHAKAFEYMVATGTLKCNVKFMIEGEEEIGSPSLPEFCRQHKDMLKSDIILVSDTSMIAPDIPSITSGLRGLAYWEVKVTGPNADLHSGIFGGAVANPINVLCKMIGDMIDDHGHITIPGFYDDVLEVSAEERAKMAKAPFNLENYQKSLGIRTVHGEEGFSTSERTGIRPTFDVCGIWGGYTGEGAKTVLPSVAHAKISCRLVPHRFAGIQGCRESLRGSLWQTARARPFRREHSHHCHFRGSIGCEIHPHGLRPGQRCHPLPQRELPVGTILQRHPHHPQVLQIFHGERQHLLSRHIL